MNCEPVGLPRLKYGDPNYPFRCVHRQRSQNMPNTSNIIINIIIIGSRLETVCRLADLADLAP